MDAFILVFTLGIMLAIGVPVAYAVGIKRHHWGTVH